MQKQERKDSDSREMGNEWSEAYHVPGCCLGARRGDPGRDGGLPSWKHRARGPEMPRLHRELRIAETFGETSLNQRSVMKEPEKDQSQKKNHLKILGGNNICFNFFFFFFFFLTTPHGLRDLSSPTKDRTPATGMKARNANHETTRELPDLMYFLNGYFFKNIKITSVIIVTYTKCSTWKLSSAKCLVIGRDRQTVRPEVL